MTSTSGRRWVYVMAKRLPTTASNKGPVRAVWDCRRQQFDTKAIQHCLDRQADRQIRSNASLAFGGRLVFEIQAACMH